MQVQEAFGLIGIDILIKSTDGKNVDDDLLEKLNNGTIIIQKNNNFVPNVNDQQKTSPITQ